MALNLEKWQGFTRKKINKDLTLEWNKDKSRYEVFAEVTLKQGSPLDKSRRVEGIRYTYFNAHGNDPLPGFAVLDKFIAGHELGMQVWTEKGRKGPGINEVIANWGKEFEGKIPLKVMIERVSDVLGVDDLRKRYMNWQFRYETGVYIKWYDVDSGTYKSKYFKDRVIRKQQGFPFEIGSPPIMG